MFGGGTSQQRSKQKNNYGRTHPNGDQALVVRVLGSSILPLSTPAACGASAHGTHMSIVESRLSRLTPPCTLEPWVPRLCIGVTYICMYTAFGPDVARRLLRSTYCADSGKQSKATYSTWAGSTEYIIYSSKLMAEIPWPPNPE